MKFPAKRSDSVSQDVYLSVVTIIWIFSYLTAELFMYNPCKVTLGHIPGSHGDALKET